MSSSDELYTWDAFASREEVSAEPVFSPEAALEALLQRYRRDLDAARAEADEARAAGVAALGQQAVYVVQLAEALERYAPQLQAANLGKAYVHIRLFKSQMLDALRDAGLEIEVPLRRPLRELAADVNIHGFRHLPGSTEEIVAEVLEPIVRQGTKLIHSGRVIVGAPNAVPEISEAANAHSDQD